MGWSVNNILLRIIYCLQYMQNKYALVFELTTCLQHIPFQKIAIYKPHEKLNTSVALCS